MHQEVVSADLLRALTSHSKFTEGPFQSSSLFAMLALLFVFGGRAT